MKQANQLGKLPPQAIDIEEAVLGILILYPNKFVDVSNLLNENVFYKECNQIIFNAIRELFLNSRPTDLLSLTEKLRQDNKLDSIGGVSELMELTHRVSNSTSLEYYCHILIELHRRRLGINIAEELKEKLYDTSEEMVDNISLANELTLRLSDETSNVGGIHISTEINNVFKDHENEMNGIFNGVRTGFADLDRVLVGLGAGDSIIIAGRPGMGKTTLALNIAYRVANQGNGVGIFSLEMSKMQLVKKFMAIESQISNSRITTLSEGEYQNYYTKAQKVADLPIYINDKVGVSIDQIRSRCITMKRQHDVKLIVIDYIGLVSPTKKTSNREQEISEISRKIKALAMELEIPIISLSQLSRVGEHEKDKTPQLHHLRDSGSIEQDADKVIMLFRPQYYEIDGFMFNGREYSSENKTVCYVHKNRNAETGKVLLENRLALSSFYDISVDNFIEPNLDF
jgi:replicative DNA helicase